MFNPHKASLVQPRPLSLPPSAPRRGDNDRVLQQVISLLDDAYCPTSIPRAGVPYARSMGFLIYEEVIMDMVAGKVRPILSIYWAADPNWVKTLRRIDPDRAKLYT